MNNKIFYFFHNSAFQNPVFDSVVRFFAEPFIYILIGLAIIFICKHYHTFTIKDVLHALRSRKIEIAYIPVATAVAWCAAKFLKIIIHTDRPFVAFTNVQTLFQEVGYAFPSGHSMTASALAFAVFFTHKRTGIYFFVGALCIGISRVIAGVHFPIDIVGGFLFGYIVALVFRLIFKVKNR